MLARSPDVVLTALEHVMREWFHDVRRDGATIAARGCSPHGLGGQALRAARAGYLAHVFADAAGARIEVRLLTRDMKHDLEHRWQALVNIEDVLREVAGVLHVHAHFAQGGDAVLRCRAAAFRWAWITGGALSAIVAIAVMIKVIQAAFG